MEVQSHGNIFEDLVIRERTGISKDRYDSLKPNGYTSVFDLSKGEGVDYNGSIKTTNGNTICSGDVMRMITHNDYHLIVGVYTQKGGDKVFHTQYEFIITPDDREKLWGTMNEDNVGEFVEFVKNIPSGKEGQQSTKSTRKLLQERVQDPNSLMKLNPKVDSKNQRRVQCSVGIKQLISSGIQYTQKPIDITVKSGRRQFNK